MSEKDEVMLETCEVKKEGVGLKDLSTSQKVVGAGLVSAALFGIYSGAKAIGNIKIGKDKTTLATKIGKIGKAIKNKLPKRNQVTQSTDEESK